jgi:hydrogenase expression/formation protein HypE
VNEPLLERIETVRQAQRGKYYLGDKVISMAHGSGGKSSQALIEGLIVPALRNPELERLEDCARLPGRLVMTSDSYVIDPVFFPGGDIGSLAVHGTLNDLATSGAEPLGLSLAMIIEEGFALADLRRILDSAGQACRAAGVSIVTGDTKVVPRAKCDRIYLTTTGVGVVQHERQLSMDSIQPGDVVLVSGPIGDHGIAIMGARGDLGLELDVLSDSACILPLTRALLAEIPEIRCFKDPTRGGVATALNEMAQKSSCAIAVEESQLPVRDEVRGACELLGIDPLYVANEGRLLAVVSSQWGARALELLGPEARPIARALPDPAGTVYLRTSLGGTRVLDMLAGAPLPRIC